ncbi:MAG: hypothetical protein U0Z44_16580 [Kouleothrix sp.]
MTQLMTTRSPTSSSCSSIRSQEPINHDQPGLPAPAAHSTTGPWEGQEVSAPARARANQRPIVGYLATPTRLEISSRPPLPELPPLLLAGVRAALFQTLAQEAHAIYQALLTQQPAEQHGCVLLAVEPARLGAPPNCSSTHRRSTPP